MPHPTLPAVDELADLRRTLAQLRQRELELCDEIRTGATEMSATRIEGDTRVALIETRAPRILDMSKLPSEILNDPNMFSTAPQTHVLLWPKANTVAVGNADVAMDDVATDSPDIALDSSDVALDSTEVALDSTEVALDNVEVATNEIDVTMDVDDVTTDSAFAGMEDTDTEMDGAEIAMDHDIAPLIDTPDLTDSEQVAEPVLEMGEPGAISTVEDENFTPPPVEDITELEAPDSLEESAHSIPQLTETEEDVSATAPLIDTADDISAPADLMDTEPEISTEAIDSLDNMMEPTDLALPQDDLLDEGVDTQDFGTTDTATIDLDLDAPMSEALDVADEDLTLDNVTLDENAPVVDIAGDDAPLAALDMPALDAHDIADTAEETAPPADLLATQHTDLQPMGDLTEEDLVSALDETDQSLPAAVDTEAVLDAEAMQAEFDTRADSSETFEDDEPAPFMTRRIIGAPA